jgi:uncharacterized protein
MDRPYILQDLVFTWDADKAEANLGKHAVSFEEACEVFFDPLYSMKWRMPVLRENNVGLS